MDVFLGREHRLVLLFEKVARFFLYAAIVLIPVAYLPWTSSALEINKQTVLVFCAMFALLAWLGSFVVAKTISYKKTGVNIALLVLFVSVLISTLFSLSPMTSLFGGVGHEYISLMSWAAFAILFFIGANLLSSAKSLYRLIDLILVTMFIVMLFGALSVFGINLLDQNFIGTPNALGVMAVAALAVSLSVAFLHKEFDRAAKTGFSKLAHICVIPNVIFVVIILYGLDYWFLWVLNAIAVALVLSVMLLHDLKHVTLVKVFLPVLILVLSIVFAFVPTPGQNAFPPEIAPTYSASYQITKETLGSTSWLFGAGPGTFEINYNLHKPAEVNYSDFWNVSFNRSGSHWLTLLSGLGIVGLAVYLFMLWILKMRVMKWIVRERHDERWLPVFALSIAWAVLVTSQVLYSSNLTILALMWLIGAAILGVTLKGERTITYKKTPRASLTLSFGFIICALVIVTTGFVSISRYAADIAFAQAVAHSESGEDTDLIVEDMVRATELNKWNDVYARNLSHVLLIKTAELLIDPEVNPESVQGYIASTIFYAQRAVELAPNVVDNQAMLGDVYREVTSFVTGADVFAIEAYENAIALSPVNPMHWVSLGRARIAQADVLEVIAASEDEEVAQGALVMREDALALAVEAFTQALTLKSDYSVGQYYLSLAFERQGNLTEAIAGLQALQSASPYDAGLAFQLGLLYLQQGKLSDAQAQLEYVVELSPAYSNARWFLASALEQQGDIEGAIEQIEFVLEQNPDNELISQRLERLQAGLVTEDEVEPLEEVVE